VADNNTTKEFVEQFVALVDKFKGAIWNEAFKAGGEAMRDSILKAAQSPSPSVNEPPDAWSSGLPILAAAMRAPRGSVGRAIDALLREHPGLSVGHMEKIFSEHHQEIAQKSIGNELRRMEGNKYKRDRPGGYRWFLIDQQVDQKVGEPTHESSASDIFNGRRL
jgi:hypothetical protein